MNMSAIEQIGQLVTPLLQTLETLESLARNFHPLKVARALAGAGSPDEALREARAMPAWPDPYSAMRPHIDQAADEALAAFAGMRKAAASPDPLFEAFRALGRTPRALEALYPLAGVLAPVNRFFLDAEHRLDSEFQNRFLLRAPDGTGHMRLGEDPNARACVWAYVPETYSQDKPAPLMMCLHGGGGRGRAFLWSWLRDARSRGAILIAPTSVGETWAIAGHDADTPRLVRLLDFVRRRWNVDPNRMLLTGMSDGGTFTYASGLGPGSPFTHLAPVSAAFHPMLAQLADRDRIRNLPIHIVHGALDWMFPIDMAREAERHLRSAGAAVTIREVDDLSHAYPTDLNGAILSWLMQTQQA